MSGDPQRVIDHLRGKLRDAERAAVEADHKANYYENQAGELRLKWIAATDQLQAAMAQAQPPVHHPVLAPSTLPLPDGAPEGSSVWGCFCLACSAESEDYVYPCRALGEGDEWPAQFFVSTSTQESSDV